MAWVNRSRISLEPNLQRWSPRTPAARGSGKNNHTKSKASRKKELGFPAGEELGTRWAERFDRTHKVRRRSCASFAGDSSIAHSRSQTFRNRPFAGRHPGSVAIASPRNCDVPTATPTALPRDCLATPWKRPPLQATPAQPCFSGAFGGEFLCGTWVKICRISPGQPLDFGGCPATVGRPPGPMSHGGSVTPIGGEDRAGAGHLLILRSWVVSDSGRAKRTHGRGRSMSTALTGSIPSRLRFGIGEQGGDGLGELASVERVSFRAIL
jgi:hypothetical protein